MEKPHIFAALAKLALHLAVMDRYGFFIDEYYYIACSDHLAAGYVDHPPLSLILLAGVRALLGDSIYAIRIPAALAGTGLIYLCGALAQRMGGGRFARGLAALAALIAPFYMGMNNFYSMNSLDLLLWAGAFYVLVDAMEYNRTRDWLVLGVLLGLGLLNKLSVLFLGVGLAGGILLSPARRLALTKGPWLAAGVAVILFIPHVAWQYRMDWPTLEFMRNAALIKNNPLTLLEFTTAQFLSMHPLLVPLWMSGLFFLLIAPAGRPYRVLGWVFVLNYICYVAMNGKAYYLAPAYCVLLAGGARWVEGFLNRIARPLVVAVLLAGGMAMAPLAMPILPVETYIAYNEALGLIPPKMENGPAGRLPQTFADMFGYPEVTETVLGVVIGMNPEERKRVVIYAADYGLAGSLRFLGRERGMPPVYGGHNNFYYWGPGKAAFDPVIVLGAPRGELEKMFGDVREKARVRCRYCRPGRRNLPVYLCRDRKVPVKEFWKRFRRFM